MAKKKTLLERASGVKPRHGWRALVGALFLAALVPWGMTPAQTTPAEAVVVATTAPAIPVGQVVRAGDFLDVPAGASVTLLEQTGAFTTLETSGPYVPAQAAASRARSFDAGRLVSAVATLVRVDENDVQMRPFRGGGGQGACAGVAAEGGVDTLLQLMRANCATAARKRLDNLVAAAAPARLYLASTTIEAGTLRMALQSNFDAALSCNLERPEAAPALLTLRPATLVANKATQVEAAWPEASAKGALACVADGGEGRSATVRHPL